MQPHQLIGALLEEAILSLLRSSGYDTRIDVFGDPTIDENEPRISIRGRGALHQIDAVGDLQFGLPFTNPIRLLVEAKAYKRAVSLSVVRNALGTLHDIGQFWAPGIDGRDRGPRYNYRFAIFSISGFSKNAEAYALAHDIYLLPLERSAYFKPVVDELLRLKEEFAAQDGGAASGSIADIRESFRHQLNESNAEIPSDLPLRQLAHIVRDVNIGVIGVAAKRYPIFLIPRDDSIIQNLRPVEYVRVFVDPDGWYIRREDGTELFSFDLPSELLNHLDPESEAYRDQLLHFKGTDLSQIDAFVPYGSTFRLVSFRLDEEWISRLIENLNSDRST